jgi:hypothetical protein
MDQNQTLNQLETKVRSILAYLKPNKKNARRME